MPTSYWASIVTTVAHKEIFPITLKVPTTPGRPKQSLIKVIWGTMNKSSTNSGAMKDDIMTITLARNEANSFFHFINALHEKVLQL